jgi:hypothetical protein
VLRRLLSFRGQPEPHCFGSQRLATPRSAPHRSATHRNDFRWQFFSASLRAAAPRAATLRSASLRAAARRAAPQRNVFVFLVSAAHFIHRGRARRERDREARSQPMNRRRSRDHQTRRDRSAVMSANIWARKITAAWQQTVRGIFAVGDLLLAAREKLPRDQFELMVREKLTFSERTAERLMAIARCKWLRKATHVSLLPAAWGTLYEITRLKQREFDKAIHDGIIRPDVERWQIAAIIEARPMPSTFTVIHEPRTIAVPVETFEDDPLVRPWMNLKNHLEALTDSWKEPERPEVAIHEAALDALDALASDEINLDVLVKVIAIDAERLKRVRRAITLILKLKALLDVRESHGGSTPLRLVGPSDRQERAP